MVPVVDVLPLPMPVVPLPVDEPLMAAPPVDVRAVPELGPPSPVSVHELSVENHEVVMEETYTVRLEPRPAEIITIFEEIDA